MLAKSGGYIVKCVGNCLLSRYIGFVLNTGIRRQIPGLLSEDALKDDIFLFVFMLPALTL